MSPYLFILSMDPLAQLLEAKRRSAQIRGLKVARSANLITCSLFADDLLLMGRLCYNEINQIVNTLNLFSAASGLVCNPSKSKVWFSANSTASNKEGFRQFMQVNEAGNEERYLGCPVVVDGSNSFDYLIEKFEKRLNKWKANFLSHAGRLVLIKSVLDSMPIYAMGTIILPKKVTVKLTAIARNFFWGGNHDKRSLAYVAWGKITTPRGMGGLGLRSIEEMNKALVMKVIWKLASNEDAQWVQVLKAKYFPRGAFWTSQRRTRCSKLWRNLMDLRPLMQNHICWKIGSGENILVYSQPWFPDWMSLNATTSQQRQMRVSALMDPDSRNWDFQALQELLGFSQALAVATLESVRPAPSPAPDTLIFAYAKNGCFSVSKAYHLVKGPMQTMLDKAFWDWLWGRAPLLPKLKIFLWRGVHGALPVKAVLAARIATIDPLCTICKREPETMMHCLFHCDFARGAWLLSNFGLRSDRLLGDFRQTIKSFKEVLTDQDMCSFVCMLWALWRSRNEAMYGEKTQSMQACTAFYTSVLASCQTRLLQGPGRVQTRANQVSGNSFGLQGGEPLFFCYVDGSWDERGAAGVGIYIVQGDAVVYWISKAIQALSPGQAEAAAVVEGLKAMQGFNIREGVLFTDSQETLFALGQSQPLLTDWRSHREIWQAWVLRGQMMQEVKLEYCNRDHLKLIAAHRLANQARMYDWDRNGHSEPVFNLQVF